jgi:membrane protein
MILFNKIRISVQRIVADDSKTFASSPRKFHLKDWKEALVTTKDSIKDKRLGVLAAGVAYFSTLAIFPAIAAGVAILGFALSPAQLRTFFASVETYLPSDIGNLITTQLEAALKNPSSGVLIILFGLLISLFSLSGAVSNVISAANAVYETTETRKFLKLRLASVLCILGGGVMLLIVLGLLILNQSFMESIGIPSFLAIFILIIRWAVIAAVVAVGLSAFYRYAPDRQNRKWQWVTWGSCIATVIWLLGTALFFIYAKYFAHFTESYSVFAGIIVLMTWLNLTAFAILIGAEINYRLENQTRARTAE